MSVTTAEHHPQKDGLTCLDNPAGHSGCLHDVFFVLVVWVVRGDGVPG